MRLLISLYFFLITVNSFGQYQWAKLIGGVDFDFASAVAVDKNSNSYVTGSYKGTVDFDPGSATFNLTSVGGADVFLLKIDPAGNFVWAKSMGGVNTDEGKAVAVDAAGNIYCTGNVTNGGDFDPGPGTLSLGGPNDIFIVKFDAAGNLLWGKSAGGDYFDYAYSIAVDTEGNVYTAGHYEGSGDYDPGPGTSYLYSSAGYSGFILKLDTNGNFSWARSVGNSALSELRSIALDPSGNLYAVGAFQGTIDFSPGDGIIDLTSAGDFDIYVLKLDPSGALLWSKALGGPALDAVFDVHLDNDKNVFLTGSFAGISDMDPGAGEAKITSSGLTDVFVTKLDSDGKFSWARSFGGSDRDTGNSVAADPSGNIIVAGIFSSAADLDPGDAKVNVTSAGEYDAFIVGLTSEGVYMSGLPFGSMRTDNIVAGVSESGSIVAAGLVSGNVQLNSFNLTAVGNYDIVVLKIDPTITGIDEGMPMTTHVYPNPATNRIYITAPSPEFLRYRIIDSFGHQATSGSLNETTTAVDISGMSGGLSVVILESVSRTLYLKMLKK